MPTFANRNILLVFLCTAFALDHLDRHVLNITLNQIGTEFALNDLQLGLLSGLAFALVHVLFAFPLARLAIPGRRKTLILGALSAWSVLTMAVGAAQSFAQLFALRFGVGAAEAGYAPAAHSMIAGTFPREKRATALAAFSAATNVGLFLAFVLGGIVAANHGWRMAFLLAGLPGVALALAMAIWMREPRDGDTPATGVVLPGYLSLFRRLIADPATRHVLIGAGLTATVGLGATTWVATFLIRAHEMPIAQVGLYLACVIGIGGAFGTAIGGRLADWFGREAPGRRFLFVAGTIAIAKPVAIAFYLCDATWIALALFVLPAAFGAIFTAPSFAHVYGFVAAYERPMATAIMMLILNLIGLSLGPFIVGALSSLLTPRFGPDGLGYAMVVLQVIGLWGGWHFWRAGRLIAGVGTQR